MDRGLLDSREPLDTITTRLDDKMILTRIAKDNWPDGPHQSVPPVPAGVAAVAAATAATVAAAAATAAAAAAAATVAALTAPVAAAATPP